MAAAFMLTALLTLLIAIAANSAKPVLEQESPMKLPLTELRSLTKHNVVEHDRRRLRSYTRLPRDQDDSASISIKAFYQATQFGVVVKIGDPPTSYKLMVDSGSSFTWIGNKQAYVPTNTSQITRNQVEFTSIYGNTKFSGFEVVDKVTIGSATFFQSFGVASETEGFDDLDFDGVFAIGPTSLLKETSLSPDTENNISTVVDNLFTLGQIDRKLAAVAFDHFNKSTSTPFNLADTIGVINLGGIDPVLFVGDITFVPITQSSPADEAWGIDMSLDYDDSSLLTDAAGIVDASKTQFLLESDAFNAYMNATGAVLDSETGFLSMHPLFFNQLKNLDFTISGVTFTLIPDAQVLPQSLNKLIVGKNADPDLLYLIVGDIAILGEDVPFSFVVGTSVLQRFLFVFDSDNEQIGVAKTRLTDDTVNVNTRFLVL